MKKMVATMLLVSLPVLIAATPDEIAAEMSERIMSPYCPGVTLHDCPSDQAIALRDRIAEWARSGLDEAQISDRLVAEFGPQILAVPPARGFNLLAWIVPAAVTLLGGATVLLLARRWKGEPGGGAHELAEADRMRIESELRALEEGL